MRISTLGIFNQSINDILDQQALIFTTQQQLATGKRVISPSSDPLAFPSISAKRQLVDTTDQFQRNSDLAVNRLEIEENSIQSSIDLLHRVRDLAVQGASSSVALDDRTALRSEVQMRLDELLGIANTRGATGEYLFAGYKTSTIPFSKSGSTYTYNGDQGQNYLRISSSLTLPVTDHGYEVFFNMMNGNGRFAVDEGAAANTGGAHISVGTVVDEAAYDSTITSTITFADDGTGGHTYTIDNPAVGATAYTSGSTISFNGIEVVIEGTPVAGDTFRVQPSSRQSVFASLQDLVTNLGKSTDTDAGNADFVTTMNRSLSEIDLAIDHLISVQTKIGARINSIESEQKFNSAVIEKNESILSSLEDVDFAEAVAEFNRLKIGLEAAHSTFAQVQRLSLFELLQ